MPASKSDRAAAAPFKTGRKAERCVSIGEAARVLGVSITTLRCWEATGRLKAEHTDGGHRRNQGEDAVLEEGLVASAADHLSQDALELIAAFAARIGAAAK